MGLSRCIYCKKRIGLFQPVHNIGNDNYVHDFCFNDYQYQEEERKLKLRLLNSLNNPKSTTINTMEDKR